jgi:hypothetical protein
MIMKLTDLESKLQAIELVQFLLPNKQVIPEHFHITEVGVLTRKFIDCGGNVREVNNVHLQLWVANDVDHRLSGAKLLAIIQQAEQALHLENWDVIVEYQQETLSTFGIEHTAIGFQLVPLETACLAEDACGIPAEKPKITLKFLGDTTGASCCSPGNGCC